VDTTSCDRGEKRSGSRVGDKAARNADADETYIWVKDSICRDAKVWELAGRAEAGLSVAVDFVVVVLSDVELPSEVTRGLPDCLLKQSLKALVHRISYSNCGANRAHSPTSVRPEYVDVVV
jgi:hypothetical protein